MRPRGRWDRCSVNSRASLGSSVLFWCVRSNPVPPAVRRVRSGALGPFLCALGVVRLRSVHSRAPWGCVHSVPVRQW